MKLIILGILSVILLAYTFWYYRLRKRARKKAQQEKSKKANQWDQDFLQSKRQIADPKVDAMVEAIMEKQKEKEVNHIFRAIVNNNDALPEDTHPDIKAFFEETGQLPEWADPDLIKMGQLIYLRHGLPIAMLLFYKSLPECYTGAKGAEVLIHSNRLNQRFGSQDAMARRLAETGLFIYNTMMPKGLDAEGQGIRAAQKVRLIHAVIRYFIKKHGWDVEKNGMPINQEDMAGTLMSFSALVLEGLDILGIDFNETEREAYIHCWRVIGHIMGVQEDLIPVNAEDSLALGHAIIDHQKAKSEAGQKLAQALLAFCNNKAPFFIHKDFHINMLNILMGRELAELLSLPEVNKWQAKAFYKSVKVYSGVREFFDHIIIFDLPIQLVDRLLLKISISYLSHNKVINFYMPPSLTADWE